MELRDKFEILLDLYRKPDGSKWRGIDFHRATDGDIHRGYITTFRKGRISEPRYEKLRTIANLMGFDPQLWFEEPENWPSYCGRVEKQEQSKQRICDRLNHLFNVIPNPKTNKPFTTQEVADVSKGRLSEMDVKELRECDREDPTMGQILALSEVFGVDQGYWYSEEDQTLHGGTEAQEDLVDDERMIAKSLEGFSEEDKASIINYIRWMASKQEGK